MPWRKATTAFPPDRPCLLEGSREVTYGGLLAAVDEKAGQLAGYKAVALQMDNAVDWVLWDLAAQTQGVVLVPLPPFFTATQTRHALETAGVEAVITPAGLTPTHLPAQPLPTGTQKITFTSGTTGRPKGVCLSAEAQWQVAQSLAGRLQGLGQGRHLASLPLGVLLENVAGVYTSLLLGNSVLLPSLQDFGVGYSQLHTLLHQGRVTSLITVPEQLRLLMAQTAAQGPLPDLRFVAVGGAKVSEALVADARQLGLPVYEGYGLSEMASVVALNTPDDDTPGSVGRLLPHVKAEVVKGEIICSPPLFLGYVGEPAPRRFPSGDLGRITPEGLVHVDGRRKNVLITAWGRNVSPEWVEAEILRHPAIKQVLVYGDALAELAAFVVSSKPVATVAEALRQANQHLPSYAQVARFALVPAFTQAAGTLTGTGRPKRDVITNMYNPKETPSYDILPTA